MTSSIRLLTPATSSFRRSQRQSDSSALRSSARPASARWSGQIVEEVAVVRSGMPAVRAARPVGSTSSEWSAGEALFVLGLQVAADHVVQADAARGEIEAKQKRLIVQARAESLGLELVESGRARPKRL